MLKKIVIALLLLWIGAAQAMLLPRKKQYEKILKKRELKRTEGSAGPVVEMTPAVTVPAPCRSRVTTPQRYGSDLSSHEFDLLAFAPLVTPVLSSDHVLCTEKHILDPKGKETFERLIFRYWALNNCVLQNGDKVPLDVVNVMSYCLCNALNINDGWNCWHYTRIQNEYRAINRQALVEVDECIAAITKKLDQDEPVSIMGKKVEKKDLEAALAKLNDDKYLLQHEPFTERNLVRSFQYNNIRNYDFANTSPYSAQSIFFGHKKFFDKALVENSALPITHSGFICGIRRGIYCRMTYNEYQDLYWQKQDLGAECTRRIPIEERKKLFCSHDMWKKYPHYNSEIHGPDGIICLKYPHDPSCDFGKDGEGSTWIRPCNAKAPDEIDYH